MADREVRIRFTGDSKVLKNSASEVRTVFQKLIEDENDARGAGEKLAAAQKIVADKMRAEMKAVTEAADVLADSLGPEMVAAIEASGRTVEDEVTRWQKLGLTLNDIMMDSDQIAQGMREMDDAARMSTGAVGDGFKKVEQDAGHARDAMGNFAGNVAGDMAQAATGFGPMSSGIGQIIEGALSGRMAIKSLIGTAAGMGAVAALMQGYASNQERAARADAFDKSRVEAYAKAFGEGLTKAQALTKTLEEAGKIEVQIGGVLDEIVGGDVTQAFADAGVSIDQFALAVSGGEKGALRLQEAMAQAGVNGDDAAKVMMAVAAETERVARAEEMAGAFSAVFGTKVETAGSNAEAAAVKHDDLATAIERVGTEWDTTKTKFGAGLDFEGAVYALQSAEQAFAEAKDDRKTKVDETAESLTALKGAAEATSEAWVAQKAAAAEAAGEVWDNQKAVAAQVEWMGNYAATLAPDSPLRTWLLQYIEDLKKIPHKVATELALVTSNSARTRSITTGKVQMFADGTDSAPAGAAVVGEDGPELVVFGGGERVIPAGKTASILRGSSEASASPASITNTHYWTINASGMTPEQLVRTLKAHIRDNGGEL